MRASKVFFIPYLPSGISGRISLGLLCVISFWYFTPRIAVSQTSVQRDQQAMTILNQTIAAGGGQQLLTSIQDFIETGIITYDWTEQTAGTVTVKSRGAHQFRIDAELSTGKRTIVLNGESGLVTDINGLRIPILRQGAVSLRSLTFPYAPLIEAIQDSSISIVYVGLVTHNDILNYDIRLTRVFDKKRDPGGDQSEESVRDCYIDPKTFFVSAVSDRIQRGDEHGEAASHEVIYSNYQAESGVAVPMTIRETMHGKTSVTIALNQITFNPGLSDSDFAW